MKLEDIVEEIESVKFYLERKFLKRLIHNESYNIGYILNFTKKREMNYE